MVEGEEVIEGGMDYYCREVKGDDQPESSSIGLVMMLLLQQWQGSAVVRKEEVFRGACGEGRVNGGPLANKMNRPAVFSILLGKAPV